MIGVYKGPLQLVKHNKVREGRDYTVLLRLIPVLNFPVLGTAISLVLTFAVGWHFVGLPGDSGLRDQQKNDAFLRVFPC